MTLLGLGLGCCAAILSLLCPGIAVAQTETKTDFSCTGLDAQQKFAAIEGLDGVFYRIDPDMQMFHAFSDGTADQLAQLSKALASLGTTLIYVPVPTKSLAMTDQLPPAARDYGFDANLATTVYLEGLKKLQLRGVIAVDARKFLHVADSAAPPSFFLTDYRMTAAGAEREAAGIAAAIAALPDFAALPKGNYETSSTGRVVIDSAMRQAMQRHCLQPLPLAETEGFAATRLQGNQPGKANSIFNAKGSGQIAVIGTEVDGEPAANLAGFVAKATGLDAVQYAVTGGGPFAAISSYLTSGLFQESRPTYLVWTNPVENNLAQFGDQPFAELIAAAGDNCRVPLALLLNPQTNSVVADLTTLDAGQSYTLMVDADGAEATTATFDFTSASGLTLGKSVRRSKDQVKTGRFFMPMTGLWPEGAQSVEIKLDVPPGSNIRVTACFN